MKKNILAITLILTAAFTHAQRITLPVFLKWHTNNAPDCKNVILTKDSMVLPVKNKCRSEGELVNWRPSVDISNVIITLKIPAGSKVQLTITYKFIPVGDDIFGFDSFFSGPDDFNGTLRTVEDNEHVLPPSIGYITKTLLMNFGEMSDPIFKAPKTTSGELTFGFKVTTNGGETHTGSKAVIKSVVLEVIK